MKTGKKKKWYDYLWIATILYLALGFFNIVFAWLGLICFFVPLFIAVVKGNKAYCNKYCGRGQLLSLLGNNCRLSGRRPVPKWLHSKWFRYGFLIFFMTMFINMLFQTYLVFTGAESLRQAVKLFWSIRVPWQFAYKDASIAGIAIAPWVAQFAFGFYSIMLTSTLLGIVTMAVWKPRSWCVYCPMGTMTQGICKLKDSGRRGKQ